MNVSGKAGQIVMVEKRSELVLRLRSIEAGTQVEAGNRQSKRLLLPEQASQASDVIV